MSAAGSDNPNWLPIVNHDCHSAAPRAARVHAAAKRQQRDAAAARPDSREFDYLRDEIAGRVVDRLNDITRSFPVALDMGCNTGNIVRKLREATSGGADMPGDIRELHMLDYSRASVCASGGRRWLHVGPVLARGCLRLACVLE
jgi:hypothetical protein